ncbi:MAG: glycoside hydrolase family 3 N-terminal domain-containing protein [Bacteroidales bacterium]
MKTIIAFFFIFSLVLTACNAPDEKNKTEQFTYKAQDTSWKSLSLREKIGQTMMVTSDYYSHKKIGADSSLQDFFAHYPIGGLFMAQWHFAYQKPDWLQYETFIPKIMKEYEEASTYPLFFSEDFERGAGYNYKTGTKLPVEMTLGAANDTSLAQKYAHIVCRESRAMGFNWLLHPVADLNMNPLHPLVIERAVSDNAERALPILLHQMNAMHNESVISTIKHFPGDGATIADQHLITASNNLSLKDWHATYGKVFQTLIDEGAPSIMVGHINFPAYQSEKINDMYPPATLSKEIMVDLLKQEMGFSGVIVSDAMNMGGASGFYKNPLENSIQCFMAGADMILWPPLAYMDSIEARIKRGEIPMERLDDAVERIWAVREQFDLLDKKEDITTPLPENHTEFVDNTLTQLSEKSVTLIKNKNNTLPLSPETDSTILLANISYFDKSSLFEPMKKELEAEGFSVSIIHDLHLHNWQWRWDSLLTYDKVIVCFENKYFDPVGSPLLKDHEAYSLWTIKDLPTDRIIGVSFSNPYYNTFYLEPNPVLINAYSSDVYMQKAVVKLLMGDIEATATSPVNLNHPVMK